MMDLKKSGPAVGRAYEYDLACFIMRAQIFTEAHRENIRRAREVAKTVLVFVGSADEPRTYHYNPFTAQERIDVAVADLRATFGEAFVQDIVFAPMFDFLYATEDWIAEVRRRAHELADNVGASRERITLIGHSKDSSSYYLQMFPGWGAVEVANYRGLSATPFRNRYFSADPKIVDAVLSREAAELPAATLDFLEQFRGVHAYDDLVQDRQYVEASNIPYRDLPFPPTFITVGAATFQAGHVLLMRRRSRPGLGLWSLPTSYLGEGEYIESGIIRALKSKTAIKVPSPVLLGSMQSQHTFDHPQRAARGRVIGHVGLIHLQPEPRSTDLAEKRRELAVPKVRSDHPSAAEVKWWPIEEVTRSMMYEDGFYAVRILKNMLAKRL